MKASLVSAASLARLGERLDLGEFLILGRGEEKTGGRRKHAIIADCYEALIAAIYLDGGIEPARGFIERQFAGADRGGSAHRRAAAFTDDWKSALQEWLQSHARGLPAYGWPRRSGPITGSFGRGDGRARADRAGRSRRARKPPPSGARASAASEAITMLVTGRGSRVAADASAPAKSATLPERQRSRPHRGRGTLSPGDTGPSPAQSISMIPQALLAVVGVGAPARASAGSACGRRART